MINVQIIRAWLMHIQADPLPAVTTIANAVDKIDLKNNHIYMPIEGLRRHQKRFILVQIDIVEWLTEMNRYKVHVANGRRNPPHRADYYIEPTRPVIIYPAAIAKEAVHALLNR